MTTEDVLGLLQGVRRSSHGWMARCPAHPDRTPSLALTERNGRVLLWCFAGCSLEEIVGALGVCSRDLFVDSLSRKRKRRAVQRAAEVPKRPRLEDRRIDQRHIAARLEDGALDLRLAAETVLSEETGKEASRWTDEDWNEHVERVAQAYERLEHAALLDDLACAARWRAIERDQRRGSEPSGRVSGGGR